MLISADSHITEPVDLWLKYSDPDFRERAPRVVRRNGTDVYLAEGGYQLWVVPLAAAAGRDPDGLSMEGTYEDNVRPGGYDTVARRADMVVDGVAAEVLYPTFGLRIYGMADPAYRVACFRGYNRWISDFSGRMPDRLRGIGMVDLHDPAAAAAELREIQRLGLAGAMTAVSAGDDAGYDTATYDPFWAAAEALGIPISLHVLTERKSQVGAMTTNSVLACFDIQRTLSDLTFGGVFHRFPRLTIVSAENDCGWAPYFAERMDYIFDRRYKISGITLPRDTPPSALFRRNVRLTFMRDAAGVFARELIGNHMLLWSSDYPHTDSTWPDSRSVVERIFRGVPEAERRQITVENAAALYGFELAKLEREESAVPA